MEVNILLIGADLLATGGAGGLGTYLGWVGVGLGLGAITGMLGAVLALALSRVLRRHHSVAPRA